LLLNDDDSDADHPEGESTRERRVGALHVTLHKAAFASAATVQYACDNDLDLDDEAVTRSAGKHGSLEALAKIYELDGNWDSALTHGAAARGMYAFTIVYERHSHVLSGPRYTVIIYASVQFYSVSGSTSSTVLQAREVIGVVHCDVAGELKLLRLLLLNSCPYDKEQLPDAAARSGSVELLTWLVDTRAVGGEDSDNGIQCSQFATDTLIAAVQAGHLHMCEYLLQLQDDISLVAAECVAYAAAKLATSSCCSGC
jgi:hypothetical protein